MVIRQVRERTGSLRDRDDQTCRGAVSKRASTKHAHDSCCQNDQRRQHRQQKQQQKKQSERDLPTNLIISNPTKETTLYCLVFDFDDTLSNYITYTHTDIQYWVLLLACGFTVNWYFSYLWFWWAFNSLAELWTLLLLSDQWCLLVLFIFNCICQIGVV